MCHLQNIAKWVYSVYLQCIFTVGAHEYIFAKVKGSHCRKLKFSNPYLLKPDGANLWNFNLRFDFIEFIVCKIKGLGCKDKGSLMQRLNSFLIKFSNIYLYKPDAVTL